MTAWTCFCAGLIFRVRICIWFLYSNGNFGLRAVEWVGPLGLNFDAYISGKAMALLVGRHLNKIDKKGRVSVPKPFRAAMVDQGFAGIYIFPYFQSPALEGTGEAFMQRLTNSLEENFDMFSEDQEDLAAITLESTHQLSFDPEGRVTLPAELCQHAGLTTQALFVGRGSRFRIWAPDAYGLHSQGQMDRARSRGVTLPLSPLQPNRKI
ncbi:MAG: division/cell wall cluster transcriptional repressor MraZ [Magnetovibrio sp.]|nr:division/cell wall cluster transcriptional repressor MraZ [Magnetovibrio sp.]